MQTRFGRWRRPLLMWGLILGLGLPCAMAALFSVVAPPLTPLMVIRRIEGEGMDRRWVPIDAISPELVRAVIVAEDARFCRHHGFDWEAINDAVDTYEEGGRLRGASTLSMQTAKNVFLWPGRNFLRKGLEAGLTVLIETLWGKRRIIEVYLNVVEWGPGLYGAEMAAQRYFHRPARDLTRRQAAALAAILPNPRRFSPVTPSRYIEARIRTIDARMGHIPTNPKICP
ncbi:monofunctional biosynthetic peptidoglycan transglycosylase [Telmatospirillum siberiense]|uniref:Biosynthetic peptidoglycan transglycosylase n=2 Tax=Telmatospirillum siberiense TaxID=382514 RepID=A0A2N3PY95_9PROT|nr:monofunctional biosynthetic peptidoglycan transglycosylase [Telmatospirillum siberiense]